jgi:hypothetical protein
VVVVEIRECEVKDNDAGFLVVKLELWLTVREQDMLIKMLEAVKGEDTP